MANLNNVVASMPEYQYFIYRKQFEQTGELTALEQQELYENVLRNTYGYTTELLDLLILTLEENGH